MQNNNRETVADCASLARAGEDYQPPSRSNRILVVEDHWFYRTREGQEVGPYPCRSSAEKAASSFAQFTRRVNSGNFVDVISIHLNRIRKRALQEAQVPFREGESDVPRTRHPRVIHSNEHWYVATREGPRLGPYKAPEEASESAQLFTSFVKSISRSCVNGLIDTLNQDLRHP